MYGSLDISVSGMTAQRTRLTAIAANIASSTAIANAEGDPEAFRRKMTLMAPGDPSSRSGAGREWGVHVAEVVEDDAPPRLVWDPSHPFAQPEGHPDAGYVYYPSVDPLTEQVNAMDAVRAYEANVMAAEATKSLTAQALRMLA